ncbi:MAG: hypothetical protein ABIZ09_18000 [Rhodoferax sp.]
MNEVHVLPNGTDSTMEQVVAREQYQILRERLVALQSAPEPDFAAIDEVINGLSKAQIAYKATHGLIGNNANDDPPHAPA